MGHHPVVIMVHMTLAALSCCGRPSRMTWHFNYCRSPQVVEFLGQLQNDDWLVVWNMFIFPYIVDNHPN